MYLSVSVSLCVSVCLSVSGLMVSCSSILEKKRARESSGIPENGAKKHRKLEEGVHREEDSELVALNGCEIIPECSADESRELQEEDEEEEGEEEPDDDDDEEEEGEEEPDEEEEDKTITTRAFSNKEGEVSRKSPPHLKLGSMSFESSLHMFNFFYDLLQVWPIGLNLNKVANKLILSLKAPFILHFLYLVIKFLISPSLG